MLPCVHGLVWLLSHCSDSCPRGAGAIVHAYTKRGPVEVNALVTGEVMSDQFSGLVNKGMDSSPQAGASVNFCGQKERKEGDS